MPRCLLCMCEQTFGLLNLEKSNTVCFDWFSVWSTETNCTQRTDTLDVQVSTSASLGCTSAPNLAQPFPVSHLWIFRTPWSSCLSSGRVLKPGVAWGPPVRTAIVYASQWTFHKKWTGMHLGECDQLLTTATSSNPLV